MAVPNSGWSIREKYAVKDKHSGEILFQQSFVRKHVNLSNNTDLRFNKSAFEIKGAKVVIEKNSDKAENDCINEQKLVKGEINNQHSKIRLIINQPL